MVYFRFLEFRRHRMHLWRLPVHAFSVGSCFAHYVLAMCGLDLQILSDPLISEIHGKANLRKKPNVRTRHQACLDTSSAERKPATSPPTALLSSYECARARYRLYR